MLDWTSTCSQRSNQIWTILTFSNFIGWEVSKRTLIGPRCLNYDYEMSQNVFFLKSEATCLQTFILVIISLILGTFNVV